MSPNVAFQERFSIATKMQSAAIGGGSVKEQVVDFLPKRIKEVRFGVL